MRKKKIFAGNEVPAPFNLFEAIAEGEKINEIAEEKMRAFLKMLITTLRVKTSYLYHPTKQEKLKIKKYIKLF